MSGVYKHAGVIPVTREFWTDLIVFAVTPWDRRRMTDEGRSAWPDFDWDTFETDYRIPTAAAAEQARTEHHAALSAAFDTLMERGI